MYYEALSSRPGSKTNVTEVDGYSRRENLTCLASSAGGEIAERRVQSPICADIHLLDEADAARRYGTAQFEIEAAIASVIPTEMAGRKKIDVLYVCACTLASDAIEERTFPVYRMKCGELTLRDTANLKSRRKFDLIVVESDGGKGLGMDQLKKLAPRALRPQASLKGRTGSRRSSRSTGPVLLLSPGRAAA